MRIEDFYIDDERNNRNREYVQKQEFARGLTDEERAKYKDIIFVTQGHGYPAQRTPIDHPLAMKVASAVQSSADKKIILMPSSGGSLPLYLFDKVTKTYPVTIPVVNYDNNQHAENENLELGRLKEGIKTIGAVMLGL